MNLFNLLYAIGHNNNNPSLVHPQQKLVVVCLCFVHDSLTEFINSFSTKKCVNPTYVIFCSVCIAPTVCYHRRRLSLSCFVGRCVRCTFSCNNIRRPLLSFTPPSSFGWILSSVYLQNCCRRRAIIIVRITIILVPTYSSRRNHINFQFCVDSNFQISIIISFMKTCHTHQLTICKSSFL